MNQEYSEIIFDNLPSKQRSMALRKVKVPIPGFRNIEKAPVFKIRPEIKRNNAFCTEFLETVADICGCSTEDYEEESQLPVMTKDNFWGIFAWKCRKLDNSEESCQILEKMFRDHEQMLENNPQNGKLPAVIAANGLPSLPKDNVVGEADTLENDGASIPETSDKQEEYPMPEFTQYIGYIQEKNGFYNFWPVSIIRDGQVEQVEGSEWIKEEFPELGNVNFFSLSRDYIRRHYRSNEIYVVSLSEDDFKKNIQPNANGDLYLTNYKIDINQLERQQRIKRLKDVGIYPVLQPKTKIDFSKKSILVEGDNVDINDLSLIEENGVLYGPYKVNKNEDDQIQITLPSNYVVSCYQHRDGVPNYIDITIKPRTPGDPRIVTRNVLLNDDYVHEIIDKISDEDLFKSFSSFVSRKGIVQPQISPSTAEDYAIDEFLGLPDDIIKIRVQRIKEYLENQLKQVEIQKDIADFTAGILFKFGDSEQFSNVLGKILDDKDLSIKIQSFKIVQQRVESKQKEYDSILEKCRQAEADEEKRISELAEKVSNEVRKLSAQKEELQQEIVGLQSKKAEWKEVSDLDDERKYLERRIAELSREQEELGKATKSAADALEEKLRQTTENAVDAAFDGRIADQIFQAAAGWNRHNQDEMFKIIAAQLVGIDKTDFLSEDALVEYLITSVKRYRPDYSKNEILNIFISISQNFLTVFSGEPGTGKTSICNILAHILGTSQIDSLISHKEGIEVCRYVPISVERGWTSKRDFIGYYNPLSQAFEKANKHLYDGLKILNAEGQKSKYPFIILLDEANLSPIEYYWADFMNICDSDSPSNIITLGNDIQMHIPPTLRFTATINNDDTTERLSPRLLDRATLIRLPDVKYQKIEDENLLDNSFVKIVPWDVFQKAFTNDDEMDVTPKEIYKDICLQFRKMRICISPRVDRAILEYWASAKKWFETENGIDQTIIALDYAVAQRLLPKINGSGITYKGHLGDLREICEKNNLLKCAKILKDIIDRGQDTMNYYQYF